MTLSISPPSLSPIVDKTDLKRLEKENRILRKKLERYQSDLKQVEATNENKERLLRRALADLRESQESLAARKQTIQNLKQSQSQLVHAEKMSSLGQLVAGIAHEINNPVNFIYGNIEHLSTYFADFMELLNFYEAQNPDVDPDLLPLDADDIAFMKDDIGKVLTSMHLGSDRIRDIVQSLRNFSRLDEAEFKAVDIHDGINNTLLILRHRWSGKTSTGSTEIVREYGDLPSVECCAGQLNQVFMNLLANAIDVLEEAAADHGSHGDTSGRFEPTITITTTYQPEHNTVQVAIADNGTGIHPDHHPKLFDPFFTTKPVGKGTGLGLAISHEIITKQHQGSIQVESQMGKGTTFILTLPTIAPNTPLSS